MTLGNKWVCSTSIGRRKDGQFSKRLLAHTQPLRWSSTLSKIEPIVHNWVRSNSSQQHKMHLRRGLLNSLLANTIRQGTTGIIPTHMQTTKMYSPSTKTMVILIGAMDTTDFVRLKTQVSFIISAHPIRFQPTQTMNYISSSSTLAHGISTMTASWTFG